MPTLPELFNLILAELPILKSIACPVSIYNVAPFIFCLKAYAVAPCWSICEKYAWSGSCELPELPQLRLDQNNSLYRN